MFTCLQVNKATCKHVNKSQITNRPYMAQETEKDAIYGTENPIYETDNPVKKLRGEHQDQPYQS